MSANDPQETNGPQAPGADVGPRSAGGQFIAEAAVFVSSISSKIMRENSGRLCALNLPHQLRSSCTLRANQDHFDLSEEIVRAYCKAQALGMARNH